MTMESMAKARLSKGLDSGPCCHNPERIMPRAKIAILEPDLVNQIAAGEVVERPASVVKELVENALDAGARRVDVAVEQGGRRLIQVVDDGCGMTAAEALLSLQRHATSKLRRLEDLERIRSMGFRGEALPSIASVSRLTMITRPAEQDQGQRLELTAGKLARDEPTGCRVGTQITVAQLFFNTPARLKFLKSTATEAAHITDAVSRLALSHPAVHFTLSQDGRQVLGLPPCADYLDRARAVLGRRGKELFFARRQEPGLSVEACLGPPHQTVRTARSVTLTVNGRQIRDRALTQGVLSGYGELIDRGRYPVAVVHLDLDPSTMDVNVHPQKTEVRFHDSRRIFAVIRRCLRDALAASPWVEGAGEAAPTRSYEVQGGGPEGYAEHRRRLQEATRSFWSAPGQGSAAERRASYPLDPGTGEAAAEGYFSSLRPVGQVLATYLVCEGDDALVLVDQHAAHERVTYEGLRQALRRDRVPCQRLLIPTTLSLDPQQEATATQRGADLGRLGFELDDFGGGTWAVRALPAVLRQAEPAALVCDVLDELAVAQGSATVEAALDNVVARMACHGSVRAGKSLSSGEILALLASLDQVDFSAACPHGRPVVVRLERAELEREFMRRK